MADERYFVYAEQDYETYFDEYTKEQLLEKLNSGYYKRAIDNNRLTIIKGVTVQPQAVKVVEQWEID